MNDEKRSLQGFSHLMKCDEKKMFQELESEIKYLTDSWNDFTNLALGSSQIDAEQFRLIARDTFWLLTDYDPSKSIHDVSYPKFIYGEPDYEKEYGDDTLFITGHTPTGLIDSAYKGKIYQKHNHIAIDCGAVFGYPLGCICMNTLEEIYAE